MPKGLMKPAPVANQPTLWASDCWQLDWQGHLQAQVQDSSQLCFMLVGPQRWELLVHYSNGMFQQKETGGDAPSHHAMSTLERDTQASQRGYLSGPQTVYWLCWKRYWKVGHGDADWPRRPQPVKEVCPGQQLPTTAVQAMTDSSSTWS